MYGVQRLTQRSCTSSMRLIKCPNRQVQKLMVIQSIVTFPWVTHHFSSGVGFIAIIEREILIPFEIIIKKPYQICEIQ